MNYYKKNPLAAKINRKNTMSLFEGGAKEKDDGEFLIKNTENSFIIDEQNKQIGEMNDFQAAFDKNYKYKFAKIRYEYVLARKIIFKYREFQKGETNL